MSFCSQMMHLPLGRHRGGLCVGGAWATGIMNEITEACVIIIQNVLPANNATFNAASDRAQSRRMRSCGGLTPDCGLKVWHLLADAQRVNIKVRRARFGEPLYIRHSAVHSQSRRFVSSSVKHEVSQRRLCHPSRSRHVRAIDDCGAVRSHPSGNLLLAPARPIISFLP